MDGNFIGDSQICGLSVNESKPVTKAWIASPGSHTIKVTADISSQVTESNETNNEKTEVMSASIPYPDLIIANVSVSSDACDGGSMKINATIKNTGSNANNGFYIKYYVDGSYLATSYIASLVSNASVVSSVDWIPSPGSHNITADADYSNLVAESDENNNNKTEQFIIGYPDIEVVTIAFPAVISDGESIKINATVRNNGGCTRRGFYAAYYVNDNYLTKEYISELNSNESVVKTLNLLAAPSGLNVTVRADYTNLTWESNENNNERNATLPYAGYADLVVSSITTPASNFSDGDAITLTAHVNNTGADTLRSFSVRFEINGSYIGSKTVQGLAGGSSITINQTWTAASGSYTLRVTVDEYNTVTESGETNNDLSNALAAIPKPDIIITNITWAPETGINDGDTLAFTAAIKNNGAGSTSREFYVRFEVNTNNYTYIGSRKVSGLSAGSSIMVNQTWAAGGGEHTIRAIADEYNAIPESYEDNNNLSQGPFEVFLANLVVTNVTWSPGSIGDSDNVTFTAVVKNTGAGNTSRDFLVFFSVNDTNIGYQSVTGGIASGNSTNVTLNGVWTASLGTHTIKAVADKDNRIPEANESDNELSGIFNVTDKNPPSLVSIIPANGSIIKEAYNVTAVLADGLGIGADLINSNISVKINGGLVSGAKTVQGDKLIFTPDVQFTNGSYVVNVTAVDNESNKRTILTSFIIDTTLPVINISTLILNETTHSTEIKEIIVGGYYETPVTILINAYDTYLKSISTKLNNYSFPNGGKISVDGNYGIVARAEDRAGNSAVRIVNFTIDTPPDAPVGLGRIMQDNVTVLTWNANIEPDVAGYNVYRNGTKLNIALITGTAYQDSNITMGIEYNYQLSAVDLAGHESKLANVSPVYIALNNYGTLINGTGYLTRGFVDKISVSIGNNGDFPINVNSASFELIDMFGNVCYTVTRGAFGIPAKQSGFIENNYMINENFTSKLRVVVNLSGGGSAGSIFKLNVRNAPAAPVNSPVVTLMEGYADKINIQFTNYGSASLAIDPQELDLYLKNANGTVIFRGKGISAGTEIMPDSTGNITGLIYTPLAVPNNLSLGDVHLEAILPGHYYDSGWKPGNVFNANISAQVKYETVSPLTVYHGSLIRGSQSNFTISLLNQGTASMFVSQGYVKIYVKDLNWNVISQGTAQHSYTEVLPDSASEFKINVDIPLSTPNDIIIEAEINAACQNNICGMMPFNAVVSEQVTEPEYNANATTNKGIYNRGENVTIYGVVTSTADGTPVPDAQIKIKISNSGFTREFYVYSDAGGKYNYTFKPLSYEAGRYVVSATHPIITAMEYDSGFEIIGLYMSPKNILLEISQNTMRTIAADVRNLGASTITGIHLEITDKNTTDGVNALVSPETFNLAPGEVRSFNMDVNSSLSDSGEKSFEIKAISSNGSVEISNLVVKLHTALPVARLEPAYMQTGVKTSSMEVKKVNITNIGYGVMNNVVIVRHSVPWISIISDSDMGSIGPGESRTFDILLNSDETVEAGIYEDNFEITSSNHQTINFPIRVFITPNATGDLRFIVKNQVGDPIPSAKVSIINQKNFNLAFDGQTDSGGESLFSNVPAGRYSYKVAIPGYDNVVDEATVEAGTGKKVNVVTSLSFLKVEWEVVPTVIQDKYEIKHTITYDTRAPVPYVKADKVSEYLYILPGESYYGQITLTNMNDAVSAFNATPVAFANSELVSIEFLVDNIPELKPGESITIPYVVKLAAHHSPEVTACEEYKITFAYKWNTQCSYGVYEENGNFLFNVYALVPTDSITINIKASCVDAFKDMALCVADVACYVATGGACAALEVGIKAVSAPYRIKDCIDTASNCLNMENYCNGWQAGDCIQTFLGCIDVAIPLGSCINAVYDGAKCLAQDNCCETNPPAFPTGPPGGSGYDPYMFSGTGGGGGSGGGSGGSGGTGGGPVAPVEPGNTHYILNAISNAISNIGLPDLTLPSPWKKGKCKTSPETECINAKIEILQELTLERQAFDARLKLTNLRPDYDMTNLSININITDPEGKSANNLFFIKVTGMEGISGIENGTINGTIPINGSITINWQFIPTPGAGGNTSNGVKYAVTASINYSVKNIPFETGTWPDEITVEPMPMLTLDYFLPHMVYGDDLMTVGVKEPVIPFMFGVRINNSGYGPARNLAIDSAQPRIVSSTPGAKLEFKLLGTWINGVLVENTLKISFGNVPPGGCAIAGWQMTSSATGNFTNYTARYTHSDALGGQATSLIKNLSTHVLVKEFINDLPGEDNMFDFLVDNTSDGIPDLIYDSRCNDKPLKYVSLNFNETPSYEMPSAGLELNGSGGDEWVYAEGIDPLDNGREISEIIRSDGKILEHSNYWLGGGKLQLVDYGTTGNYAVRFIFPPKYADLIVTKLNYTPENPAEGDNVTITAAVNNSGNISFNLDEVNVSINVSNNFFGWKVVNLTNKTLVYVNFTWTAVSGEHNITIAVDPQNDFNESNETNNEMISGMLVSNIKPDLTVTGVTLNPQNPVFGQFTYITAAIGNLQNINLNLNNVNVSINISGSCDSWQVTDLTNKTKINVTFNWTAVIGEHNITVDVDPGNLIFETNETNNKLSVNITIFECYVNSTCSGNQFCNTSTHSCGNLTCPEGYYPENHVCVLNETYCFSDNNCSGSQTCSITNHACLQLDCGNDGEAFNHRRYGKCDIDHNGIIFHDYGDLMAAYKCFSGLNENCNALRYQNWNSIKTEYKCFVNAQ